MDAAVPPGVLDVRRLAAVRATELLDTAPEEAFDRLTRLAAAVLDVPFAFVTVVDETRSFWKSCVGVPTGARQGPVEDSFCQYVIGSGARLIIGDTRADDRTRHNPSIEAMGVAAWAGFPLLAPGGEVLGTFCVVDTRTRDWSERDVSVLETLSHAASGEVALRSAAARSAALARTLQESLLPPHLPDIPGIDLAVSYLPAGDGEVLGDFFDVFPVDAETWGAVLGDVSGKGVPAAKVAALARYTVRAAAIHRRLPRDILADLNEAVMAQRPHGDEGFLTAVFASLRPTEGGVAVTVCSAGHQPALVRRSDGRVHTAGSPGLILGIFADADLRDDRLVLHPADLLLLYSDGVTEARRGEEQFGEDRLAALLEASVGRESAEVIAAIAGEVSGFAGGERRDDAALLAIQVSGPQLSRR